MERLIKLGDEKEEQLYMRSDEVPQDQLSERGTMEKFEQLKMLLNEFRESYGFGRAAAAPQLGVRLRAIAINMSKDHPVLAADHIKQEQTFLIINPNVTFKSKEMFSLWDDCMCFPDKLVRVQRHKSISMRWLDEKGRQHTWNNLPKDMSELMQHEIDHLDGILATMRAISSADIISKKDYQDNKAYYDSLVDFHY